MGLFAKQKTKRPVRGSGDVARDAGSDLNTQIQKRTQLKNVADAKSAKCLKEIRQLLTQKGDGRDKAKAVLQEKLRYDKQSADHAAVLTNLQTELDSVRDTRMNVNTIQALQAGAKEIKAITKGIGNIDDVMIEVEDTMAVALELSDMVATPFAGMEVQDDADLEAQLGDMETLMAEDAFQGVDMPVNMPTDAHQVAATAEPDEMDAELDALGLGL